MTQGPDEHFESPLEVFEDQPQPTRKRGWKYALIAVTAILVLAAVYVGVQAAYGDKVPGGTSVNGIDIGGMSRDEATELLTEELAEQAGDPVAVNAADKSGELDPAEAGLSIDVEATTKSLTGFTLNPARLLAHFGGGKQLTVKTSIDRGALFKALQASAEDLKEAAVDGSITIVDGEPVAGEPKAGAEVDIDAAVQVVADQWMKTQDPITLPMIAVEPAVSQQDVEVALSQAQTIVEAPVWVEVGGQRAQIPQDEIAAALSYTNEDGQLVAKIDSETLRDAVLARTKDLEQKAKNAYFSFNKKNKPVIKGGRQGLELDGEEVARQVLAAAQTEERSASVTLKQTDPKVTKASLKELGVKEVVAEFSTPLTSEPIRTINIANAGKKLTGYLVKPGETFSLEKAIGPVTAENGYREAGVVVNGFHTTGMGGGLSQVATTTYNVGFLAGMVDVEHRPHTEWFSRYPEGREATIFTGSLDMKWRNDSPHGIVLRAWVANNRFYVQAWSTKYYKVESSTSARSNIVYPKTVYSQSSQCVPSSAGNPGFTVTVSRKVTEIKSGKVVIDEKNTWTYRATDAIKCGAKPSDNDDNDDE